MSENNLTLKKLQRAAKMLRKSNEAPLKVAETLYCDDGAQMIWCEHWAMSYAQFKIMFPDQYKEYFKETP